MKKIITLGCIALVSFSPASMADDESVNSMECLAGSGSPTNALGSLSASFSGKSTLVKADIFSAYGVLGEKPGEGPLSADILGVQVTAAVASEEEDNSDYASAQVLDPNGGLMNLHFSLGPSLTGYKNGCSSQVSSANKADGDSTEDPLKSELSTLESTLEEQRGTLTEAQAKLKAANDLVTSTTKLRDEALAALSTEAQAAVAGETLPEILSADQQAYVDANLKLAEAEASQAKLTEAVDTAAKDVAKTSTAKERLQLRQEYSYVRPFVPNRRYLRNNPWKQGMQGYLSHGFGISALKTDITNESNSDASSMAAAGSVFVGIGFDGPLFEVDERTDDSPDGTLDFELLANATRVNEKTIKTLYDFDTTHRSIYSANARLKLFVSGTFALELSYLAPLGRAREFMDEVTLLSLSYYK